MRGVIARLGVLTLLLSGIVSCVARPPEPPMSDGLFVFRGGVETRWASFENPGAEKGAGGR